jgi:hypothetical protein
MGSLCHTKPDLASPKVRSGFRQKAALFGFLKIAALCRDAAVAKFLIFNF